MQYNLSSFVQTKNGKWIYRANTACFSWYPWENGIQRIVYPLTVNKKFDKGAVEKYLNAIAFDLPEGITFQYKWNDNEDYAKYWEMDGSMLMMLDIRLDGNGQRKSYGLAFLCMLRYLREKPEIPYYFVKYYDQWPDHWGVVGILNYIQMYYKDIGDWTRPGYQYGHALLEKQVNKFCRNWDEYKLRRVLSDVENIARAMEGGSCNVKEIKFKLEPTAGFTFCNIDTDNVDSSKFPRRAFPEYDIPKIFHAD